MRVRVGHVSLQWSDSDRKHTADIEKLFDRANERNLAWITGTESGPGSGNTGEELIRIGKEHGYRVWVPEHQGEGYASRVDCWIAVRRNLIADDYKRGFEFAFKGSREMYADAGKDPDLKPTWNPKGVIWVEFDSNNADLGHVSVLASHYVTDARHPKAIHHGINHWELNKKLADKIGDVAREKGKGRNLVFYGGDQNMNDARNKEPQGDTFFEEKLTSTWDELKVWPNTGHGCIDVIASYNNDGRVNAISGEAFNDRRFALHTDHFYIEAVFSVEPVKK